MWASHVFFPSSPTINTCIVSSLNNFLWIGHQLFSQHHFFLSVGLLVVAVFIRYASLFCMQSRLFGLLIIKRACHSIPYWRSHKVHIMFDSRMWCYSKSQKGDLQNGPFDQQQQQTTTKKKSMWSYWQRNKQQAHDLMISSLVLQSFCLLINNLYNIMI